MQENPLKRIHKNMEKQINDVREYRKNNNLEEFKITEITNLIVKHKNWITIKNDIAIVKDYKIALGVENEK